MAADSISAYNDIKRYIASAKDRGLKEAVWYSVGIKSYKKGSGSLMDAIYEKLKADGYSAHEAPQQKVLCNCGKAEKSCTCPIPKALKITWK